MGGDPSPELYTDQVNHTRDHDPYQRPAQRPRHRDPDRSPVVYDPNRCPVPGM